MIASFFYSLYPLFSPECVSVYLQDSSINFGTLFLRVGQVPFAGAHQVAKSKSVETRRCKDYHEFQNINFQRGKKNLLDYVVRRSSGSTSRNSDGSQRCKRGRKPQTQLRTSPRTRGRALIELGHSLEDSSLHIQETLLSKAQPTSPLAVETPLVKCAADQIQVKLETISSTVAGQPKQEKSSPDTACTGVDLPQIPENLSLNKPNNAGKEDQSLPTGRHPCRKVLREIDVNIKIKEEDKPPRSLVNEHFCASVEVKYQPPPSRRQRPKSRFSNLDDDFPYARQSRNFLDKYIKKEEKEESSSGFRVAELFKPGKKAEDEDKTGKKRSGALFFKKWSQIAVEASGEDEEVKELRLAQGRRGSCFLCNPNVPPTWVIRHP